MKNMTFCRLMNSAALVGSLLLTTGCLTSPSVPDVPAVLQNWPEKIPLRVRLDLSQLDSRTERLAARYSRYGPHERGPVEVGQPLAETLRKGLPYLFDSVDVESGQDSPKGETDLLLTPTYTLVRSHPYGWTRQLSLVVDVQVVDPSGHIETISSGKVNGESKGIWRSWRWYVALPFAILALGVVEHDQWSQAVADVGEQVLKKLDLEFRSSHIVSEVVKRRYGESSIVLESPAQNLPVLLKQLCYELLDLPGGNPPQRLVIAPVYNQDGLRTHWELLIEERVVSFFQRRNRDLMEPESIQKSIVENTNIGTQLSLLEFIDRVRVHSNADAVVAINVFHQDDTIMVRASLYSVFNGKLLSTADRQIEKTWRTLPTSLDR